jgi:hypothetical protein
MMAYQYQPMNNYYGQSYYQGGAVPDTLNQYKGQYQQPMQPQPMPQQMMPAPIPSNDMIWVLGEIEATSYPVAPNNTVTLWDKNEHTVYIKSVNAQGVPSMKVLDYSERTAEGKNEPHKHECQCNKDFVHIDEFNQLKANFEALVDKVETIQSKSKTTKKGEE